MNSNKIIWVLDDHKLRREGTIGVLSPWAATSSVELKQVERPEHIYPSELLVGEADLQQLCLMGIGGRSLEDDEIQDKIRTLLGILDGRPLLVILDNIDGDQVKCAIRLGLQGLVSTYLDGEIAIRAIRYVFSGGVYFPSGMSGHTDRQRPAAVSKDGRSAISGRTDRQAEPEAYAGHQTNEPRQPLPALSDRQVEVLGALKRGYSNKLIARELNLSEATVKIHMRTLIQKFGVENRTQVALLANDPNLDTRLRSVRSARIAEADRAAKQAPPTPQ